MNQQLKFSILLLLILLLSTNISSQSDRWQQACKYKMNIDFDVDKHQFDGKQYLQYINNSPDTIRKVFYHLYFNAFQPGSMMDIRSRNVLDPDPRVRVRIFALLDEDQGYHKIKSLKHRGNKVKYMVEGTILEVELTEAILPGESTLFEMDFSSQVPLQIRRSGKNSKEGIDYSMSQWYPKLCEYDYQGWHANPYVGREFHGVWGDFEVEINIDKKQIVAASGLLVDSDEDDGMKSWKYKAENVHDFVWASDPDYSVIEYEAHDGTMLEFYYQPGEKTNDNWAALPKIMDEALRFMNVRFGKYPYPVYKFIQGGDGGMEYPMATLITGERLIGSLVGVSVHEWMHSWYQMVLATNESLYSWMDEGFTTFASSEVMNHLKMMQLIPGEVIDNPHLGTIRGFCNFALSGYEEPLVTHADHFSTNQAYGVAAYSKGHVFLSQLEYIIGKEDFDAALLQYYYDWKFKHPNDMDCVRVFEKESGMELDWFREYFVFTTKTMDYGLDTVLVESRKRTKVRLSRKGDVPMPMDLMVTLDDGSTHMYNIPLRMMRGEKNDEGMADTYTVLEDWPWTNPHREIILPYKMEKIVSIVLDPSGRMADVDLNNNVYPAQETVEP